MFPGGVGNTRKDPEAFASLLHDVETKIFDALPDETWVYPGHGNDTSLGAERPHLPEWRAGVVNPGVRALRIPFARALCELFTHAGVTHALPAHMVAQSTGSSPAQDDGSCAVRAAGLSIPALDRRPRRPVRKAFTRMQHTFPICGRLPL